MLMSLNYGLVHLIHLFCAIGFIGVVFFEVIILEGLRKPLGPGPMAAVELAVIQRAKKIMPWVVATLFLSGILLAYTHREALMQPQGSSFGALLWLKIGLALSVGGHFVYALKTAADGCMTSTKFKVIHLSVGSHMIGIVILAKGMFYFSW